MSQRDRSRSLSNMKLIHASQTTLLAAALGAVGCGDDDSTADGAGDSTGTSSGTAGALTGDDTDAQTSETGAVDSTDDTSETSDTGDTEVDGSGSFYVTMADGTRIAIDVWLPEGASADTPLPTVMRMTRYWRGIEWVDYSEELDDAAAEASAFNARGYALVLVDARGSGASFGGRQSPWAAEERADYGEIVDWITERSWSNGSVGATGVSYDGNTAAFLAALGHPAVKAVAPRFYDTDPYDSPAIPGGVLNVGFVSEWSAANNDLDAGDLCALAPDQPCEQIMAFIRGPKWVDEDLDGDLAAQAIAEHADNVDVFAAALGITFRDDAFGGTTMASFSPYSTFDALDDGGATWYSWASWLDAGTADSALDVFRETSFPHTVVIGPWDHGAEENADPFAPVDQVVEPSPEDQLSDLLDFFDAHLLGEPAPAAVREIRYYTMNEGTWRTTDQWPPAGVEDQTWYLAADGQLDSNATVGETTLDYQVDYSATTGPLNRWLSQGGTEDIAFPDRAEEDDKLVTYTSAPLETDIRVTGHPVVSVRLSTTHQDGAVYAYLEDVAPDGAVTYITEGQLRFVHRHLDGGPVSPTPGQHSYQSDDALPVSPGEVMELVVRLRPTSVRLEAGHRIRVAIAGHDTANFARLPARGVPTWTLHHDAAAPSLLSLPVEG